MSTEVQMAYEGSVIIPAHNEEKVIGRCLEALTTQATDRSITLALEIVVVCNGCTDKTSAVALKFPGITVVEIPERSKAAALNAGEKEVTALPRIYLDADTELSYHSARRLLTAAASHAGAAILSATVTLDMSRCSFLARSFARCAQRTSFGEFGVVGRGVYVLNAAGRTRFRNFPNIMGDDQFAASLFVASEQFIDDLATVTVRPPPDLRSLIRVRGRIYYGNSEGASEGSRNLSPYRGWRNVIYAAQRVRSIKDAFDLIVYIGIILAGKLAATKMANRGSPPVWQRDEASRV